MDSMDVNKTVAAVLTAGIAFMVSGVIGGVLVHPERPHESAIKIGDLNAAPGGAAPAAAPALEPVSPLLASANVQNGQRLVQQNCAACHTLNEGGRAGIGPNLYNLVGAPHGHMEGFNYSAALKGKQGPWNYEELNAWLNKPATYAPGTRMAFAGLSNLQQRADVIAYLRSLSGSPQPLPNPAAAPAPAPAAGAAPLAGGATPAAAGTLPPIAPLLASADAAAGEALAKRQCAICHTFNEGGRAGVGPNLYGVVNGPHAHMEGFNYSAAFRGHAGTWTYDDLNRWIAKPMEYAPGTRMAFAGISDPQQRANVIAYLRTLAATPAPLP